MLHPDQFQVNEAWIVFQLNHAPIHTERDGAFNCIGLMDARSCFILGTEFAPVNEKASSDLRSQRLLEAGWRHKKAFPVTLFTPTGQFDQAFTANAQQQGITVVAVAEHELLPFIGEARQGFQERFENRGAAGDSGEPPVHH